MGNSSSKQTSSADVEPQVQEQEDDYKSAAAVGVLMGGLDACDMMVYVFMPKFYVARDVSLSQVGLLWALLAVGMLVGIPAVPWVMRRIGGPSRGCFFGVAAFAAVRASCAILPFLGNGVSLFVPTAALFLVTGLTYALAEIGGMAFVLSSAPPGKKVAAFGVLVGSRSVGSLIGPPLGGGLFNTCGFSLTMLISALLLLGPLMAVSGELLVPSVMDAAGPERSLLRDPASAVVITIAASGMGVSGPAPSVARALS